MRLQVHALAIGCDFIATPPQKGTQTTLAMSLYYVGRERVRPARPNDLVDLSILVNDVLLLGIVWRGRTQDGVKAFPQFLVMPLPSSSCSMDAGVTTGFGQR
eukprot:5730950-Pyramimonas_sp.AAC.1